MTVIAKKKRATVQQKKIDKALKDALDLFEQSEKPPTHESIQEDVWVKHIHVFSKDKAARKVAFALFSYSELFYAIERGKLTSLTENSYEKLFMADGTVNESLPAPLINKVLALKAQYDQIERDAQIKKEMAFTQMAQEVGADIEQINALLLKVNKKLSKQGLTYSVCDTAKNGHDYMLEHIETREKYGFNYTSHSNPSTLSAAPCDHYSDWDWTRAKKSAINTDPDRVDTLALKDGKELIEPKLGDSVDD